MRIVDILLVLALISMALGPVFVLRKTDRRLHRWNRFLCTVGFVESALMLLIPYEQHVWRHRVFYAGLAVLGIAWLTTLVLQPGIARPEESN